LAVGVYCAGNGLCCEKRKRERVKAKRKERKGREGKEAERRGGEREAMMNKKRGRDKRDETDEPLLATFLEFNVLRFLK
jgi:hypothetical protein